MQPTPWKRTPLRRTSSVYHSIKHSFEQAGTTSSKSQGTGLGLAIVKHIALLHHARIDLQSQVGSGTTIKVTFPKA